MNVLSLFAGIGGIDLGLERAGMKIVGQVEIEPFCRAVLAKHWPEVPKHDDVRTCVDWWRSEPRPPVDLIAGGFPCQPISLAGKRRAQDDERWLWPAMASVIRALRPRYALLENVPGLLARGMGDVLADLAACGYDADWDCVPASAVGAPHRRDRVWIVAHTDGQQHESHPPSVGRSTTTVIPVADPDGERELQPEGSFSPERRRPSDIGRKSGGGLADTYRERRDLRPSVFEAARRQGWALAQRHRTWWAVEPDVGRMAYGVPRGVDRLRALGNAVVPQVAELIGRLILREACT